MINYEGISYNLETIIEFRSLKLLLEALAKKQMEHNILFYGQNVNINKINNNDILKDLKENIIDKNTITKSNNSSNKNLNKKREKSPNIFFLFNTVKNKNKKKPKSKSPNNIKTEKNNNLEISFIYYIN